MNMHDLSLCFYLHLLLYYCDNEESVIGREKNVSNNINVANGNFLKSYFIQEKRVFPSETRTIDLKITLNINVGM